jgi:aminoglycoside 3-N-acetyltransferase
MTLKSNLKKRIKGVLRGLFAPKIRAADIQKGLEVLEVPNDKPVLVHSSLSGLGYLPSGPQTLLEGILTHLGPQGNIVLPTHSWNLMNRGLRIFDVRETPSCVGAVTEWFRKQPGVVRSLHPTHSVAAMGPLSKMITKGHQDAVAPCGEGSPYARLLELDATILFLGAPLDTNTSYHCCEGLVGVPYLLQEETVDFVLVDNNGCSSTKQFFLHRSGVPRNLVGMNEGLEQRMILAKTKIGRGLIQSIRGRGFREFVCAELTADPMFLVRN